MSNFNTKREELIIVDDDVVLLVILERMFIRVNPELNILTFSNGQDALAHLNNCEFESVPFVLVDLYLEDISGWEFLNSLNANEKFDSKVILITSSVDSQNPKRSSQYKCIAGFFEKPITFEVIKSINKLRMDQRIK